MPGGVINTGSHPKALWPGVHAWWGQVYDEHPKEYPDLYEIESSDKAYEEDVQVTGFGLAAIKTQGSGHAMDSEIQGPIARYNHLAYGLGYIVTHEEKMDNQYEVLSMRRAKANAFSMAQTIENVCAAPYNNAFDSAYPTADGLELASTVHVNTTGGTFSNELNPGADLSEAALEELVVQVMGTQTDKGLLISVMPRSLIVPRQQWFDANRIYKSVLQPDTVSNNINVLKATNAFPDGIKLNHYLTSSTRWFVRTNCPNGMMMFWREKPSFNQDNDADTKNAKALAYMRFAVGNTDPRGIFGSDAP